MISNLGFNLLQSSLCLLLFCLFYWTFFRKTADYNFRRFYLICAVLLSLVLPWIPTLSWQNATEHLANTWLYQLDPMEVSTLSTGASLNLLWIYWTGVLVSLFIFIYRLVLLYKVIKRCPRSNEYYRNHPLRYTHGLISSSSFFNFLLWDNTHDLDSKHKHIILEHELTHIRELHSWDNLLVAFAKCLVWFNPLIYWVANEFSLLHELIADQKVVNEKNKSLYLSVLAEKTLAPLVLRGAHQFNTNQTLKRIIMINNPHEQTARWRYFMVVPLLAALLYIVGCDQPANTDLVASESSETDLQAQTPDPLQDREVYEEVDVLPAPDGGMEAFYTELSQNLLYPKQAKELGVEGKVYLQFIVETDGRITGLKVLKGIGAGCDAAAMEAMAKSTNWTPGKKGGRNVAVKMQLPIIFKLS